MTKEKAQIQEAKAMAIEALAQESITWIVGKDNCQVAVRNMPIDKMQKICAIIGDEGQEPCEDCISREAVLEYQQYLHGKMSNEENHKLWEFITDLPSVTPKFTDEEIQKMQELEQAQLDKAYELGKTESFEDWLSSFNTDSATKCFTAVQELKKRLEGEE